MKQYTLSSSVSTGSLNCERAKPPPRAVLYINLLGKGLTPRLSIGDRAINKSTRERVDSKA